MDPMGIVEPRMEVFFVEMIFSFSLVASFQVEFSGGGETSAAAGLVVQQPVSHVWRSVDLRCAVGLLLAIQAR